MLVASTAVAPVMHKSPEFFTMLCRCLTADKRTRESASIMAWQRSELNCFGGKKTVNVARKKVPEPNGAQGPECLYHNLEMVASLLRPSPVTRACSRMYRMDIPGYAVPSATSGPSYTRPCRLRLALHGGPSLVGAAIQPIVHRHRHGVVWCPVGC